MEDFLENIIYFVVLAVFMLVPALTRKRKQTAANIQPSPELTTDSEIKESMKKQPSILDALKESIGSEVSIFDNLFEEGEEKKDFEMKAVDKPAPEVEVFNPEEEGVSVFSDFAVPDQLGQRIEDDHSISEGDLTKSTFIEDGDIQYTKKHPVVEDFDAKKAIIYAEIMNRKY